MNIGVRGEGYGRADFAGKRQDLFWGTLVRDACPRADFCIGWHCSCVKKAFEE